jgi:hypothetical protein
VTLAVRVHLKAWILDDGEVTPFRVGEQVEWGLGIDLEQLPVFADPAEPDGIVTLPTPDVRTRARADVIGPAQVLVDDDRTPFAATVVPVPGVALAIVGPGPVDQDWHDRRIVVRGDVVVEPFLWTSGGMLRTRARHGPRAATVQRVQASYDTGPTSAPVQLVEVTEAVPHRSDVAGYLVDLEFPPT